MLQKIVNGQKWVAGKHLRDRGTRSEALLGGSSEGGGGYSGFQVREMIE